ncbi:MAG: hypothetical protein PCFJNLEI_04091 [Verrucomicrobiae bacterium]|nr:hypothetical protein [Verrucomicrobiae bacterium]
MKSKKLLIILTYGLPVLGFLVTVTWVAYAVDGFSDFLSGNITPEEITHQVARLNWRLVAAFWPALIGVACSFVGIILLVVRKRQTPPPAPPRIEGGISIR